MLHHIHSGADSADLSVPPLPQPEALPPDPPVTLFDSTGDVNDGRYVLFPGDHVAASFSTGDSAVTLSSLELVLDDDTPSDGGEIDVMLFSDSSTSPDMQIADLGSIPDSSLQSAPSLVTLTESGGPTLTADTRYWIGLSNSTSGVDAQWNASTSNGGTGVASEFVDSYGLIYQNGLAGGTLLMQVNATSTCYAAGTHILTDRGEVLVQALRPGDIVVTARGFRPAPVRWVGNRHVDLRRHSAPGNINPVRIRAHAFAPGVPHRELILSPDHAVLLDGALISVRHLLNGATIAQEAWAEITYYHIELDQHDVVLAEGLAAETFLDVGNRGFFANEDAVRVDAALDPVRAQAIWAAHACAPTLVDPAGRSALHQRLVLRAVALGHHITDDAGRAPAACTCGRAA